MIAEPDDSRNREKGRLQNRSRFFLFLSLDSSGPSCEEGGGRMHKIMDAAAADGTTHGLLHVREILRCESGGQTPPNPLYTHRPKMGRFFERLVPLFFLLPQFRSSPSLSLDGAGDFSFFFFLPSSSRVPIFIQSALSPLAP